MRHDNPKPNCFALADEHCDTREACSEAGWCGRAASRVMMQAVEEAVAQPPETGPAVDGKGLRYNAGKRDFTLIPPDALAYLADLFTIGARKYAPRNWERGMAYSNVMTSLDRHWNAFKSGEDRDPESTLYHMVHVCWNAMALLTYQLRGIGEDDRYKNPLPPTPDYDAMTAGGTGKSNGGEA